MHHLPLINVYPIVEAPHPPIEVVVANQQGRTLPPLQSAQTPYDFARAMAVNYSCYALANALARKLAGSSAYAECKRAMPLLRDVPHLHAHRIRYGSHDPKGVHAELMRYGLCLAPGQVLFHGGEWPCGKHPKVGDGFVLNRPLSTTLCAKVAGVHASYHDLKYLWVLTVGDGMTTPAFVYNSDPRQTLGNELEILIAPGASATCVAVTPTTGHTIIDVRLH